MKTNIRISQLASQFALGLAAFAMVGNAQAALVGVDNTFPEISLTSSPYLLYDHDAVNATTGQLRVLTGSSVLAEGAAAGGSTLTQSYFSSTDSIPDLMLTINVNNSTGCAGFGYQGFNRHQFRRCI